MAVHEWGRFVLYSNFAPSSEMKATFTNITFTIKSKIIVSKLHCRGDLILNHLNLKTLRGPLPYYINIYAEFNQFMKEVEIVSLYLEHLYVIANILLLYGK